MFNDDETALPTEENKLIAKVLAGTYPPQGYCNSSQYGIAVDTDNGTLNLDIKYDENENRKCSIGSICETCFDTDKFAARITSISGWLGKIYDSSRKGMFYCHGCRCNHDCVISPTTIISVGYEDDIANVSCPEQSSCSIRYFSQECLGFYDQRGSCLQSFDLNQTHASASEFCATNEAQLPRIPDMEYNQKIFSIFATKNVWLDAILRDGVDGSRWENSDHDELTFQNFGTGPNGRRYGTMRALYTGGNGLWGKESSSDLALTVCQKGTTPYAVLYVTILFLAINIETEVPSSNGIIDTIPRFPFSWQMDFDLYSPATINELRLDSEIKITSQTVSNLFTISTIHQQGMGHRIIVCVGELPSCGTTWRSKTGRLRITQIWENGERIIRVLYQNKPFFSTVTSSEIVKEIQVYAPVPSSKDYESARIVRYQFRELSVECPNGTYNTGQDCQSCPVDSYCPTSGLKVPLKCPDGEHQPNLRQLECMRKPVHCDIGTYPSNGVCKDCPEGHFCGEDGLVDPVPCKKGTYQTERGQRKCLNCPRGRKCLKSGLTSGILCNFRKQCKSNRQGNLSGTYHIFEIYRT